MDCTFRWQKNATKFGEKKQQKKKELKAVIKSVYQVVNLLNDVTLFCTKKIITIYENPNLFSLLLLAEW